MTHNWIIATGAATWTAASFDTATLPATGDTVYVNFGNANINAGLNQSAVSLADLFFGPNFQGTVASASGAPLQIGVSGTCINNSQSSQIVIDFGSSEPTIDVQQTGSPLDSNLGNEAFRIRGGGAATTLNVAGNSSVGVGTETSAIAATIATWRISNGSLSIGVGVTATNGFQSSVAGVGGISSGGVVTTMCAHTAITQSGKNCQLITGGTGTIGTLIISGTAILGHRVASGDSFAVLSIAPSGTVDVSQDPRPLTYTTSITMAATSTFVAYSPGQCVKNGSVLTITTSLCSADQVNVRCGGSAVTVKYQ